MIFTVNVKNANIIRKALVERGWVEKISPNLSKVTKNKKSTRLHIQKRLECLILSNLVKAHPSSFVWDIKHYKYRNCSYQDDTPQSHCNNYKKNISSEKSYPIRNQLEVEALWATQQGLSHCTKESCWFYIENVAEINTPRIYISAAFDEKDFMKDYLLTACTSLLKWVLTKVANNEPIFNGNISSNVIVFAINRCKEYVFMKQNRDIDNPIDRKATAGQWNLFLKSYYTIIDCRGAFLADKSNVLPLLLAYAKILLKNIHKYRPQMNCDGFHNIWIMKSANPRGKEIKLASKLPVITDWITTASFGYIIQKYIGKTK